MRKKRLLIDINSISTYLRFGHLAGIGRTTYELLRQWSLIADKIPFDLILFSLNTKRTNAKGVFAFKNIYLFWPNREKYKKVLYFFRLRKLFTRYNLVHIPHNVDVLEDVSKTILTIHDVMAYRFSNTWNDKKWSISEKEKQSLVYAAQNCKAIITCSECSKKDIVQYLNVPISKVYSIPWGVNREMFQPTIDEDYIRNIGIKGLYYFTSSANHPRKNLPLLLDSYQTYLNLGGCGQLVILNPQKEYLTGHEELIENGNIIILNKVSDKELAILYTHAHCSLMLTSYEGFGLPILESLACRTQVISARNSSLIEAGGSIIDFIDKLDSESIANKLLAYDKKEKDLILDNTKLEQHLQKFSWEVCAHKYIELYTELLGI